MCTVYCLHATKGPWFLVDMSHFLDRKPRIIFPTFLLLDSVMERLFINLKSKLGSIDRRRSLLRCIINHCQRKPCVGNAIATKLPLQISSHRLFQLFGPARLSWPPFSPASECTASTKVEALQENMIMNHIYILIAFIFKKIISFQFEHFFDFTPFSKKNNEQLNFQSPPSLTIHPSPSITKLRVLDSDGSKFITLDFWDPPSYRCFGETFRMTGGTEKRFGEKNGCPSTKKAFWTYHQSSWVFFSGRF